MATEQANTTIRSTSPDGRVLSTRNYWLLCILGIADVFFLSILGRHTLIPGIRGVFDFTGFVIGSRLLGTPYLYDPKTNLALQKAITGATLPGVIYIQPPFWAEAIKPFTALGYYPALILFLLMVGALVAFVRSFALVPRSYATLAVCWSLPAGVAIARANNCPLILVSLVVSLAFWKGRHEFCAGIMLGLCLMKFQFLMFLPFLLFRRPYRKVLAGFVTAAAAAIAVNFVVQPDWVPLYLKALSMPRPKMAGRLTLMPNFYASFFWSHHPAVGVILGSLLVSWVLWRICCHCPFELAMPLCIFGALLASPHTSDPDAILAIPALLLVARRFQSACIRLSRAPGRLSVLRGSGLLRSGIVCGGLLVADVSGVQNGGFRASWCLARDWEVFRQGDE